MHSCWWAHLPLLLLLLRVATRGVLLLLASALLRVLLVRVGISMLLLLLHLRRLCGV